MRSSRDSMETSVFFLVAIALCAGAQPTAANSHPRYDHDILLGRGWSNNVASGLMMGSGGGWSKNVARGSMIYPCFPAIFAFGDSLVDVGNDLVLHPAHRGFPYNETYMQSPRDPTRDGRLIIHFIAQGLGLEPPSSYFEAAKPNFKHGVNFGAFGATATAIQFLSPYTLDVQAYWLSRFKRNVLSARTTAGPSLQPLPDLQAGDFEKGLYLLAVGGNDYSAASRLATRFPLDVGVYVPTVLAKLNDTIVSLIGTGARNFMVVNIPPLGCSTAFKDSYIVDPSTNIYLDFDEFECIRPLNDIVDLHNDMLRELLRYLRPTHPNATFIYADYNGVIRQLLATDRAKGDLPTSMAELAGGCPSESLTGCYNNVHIMSEAANRLTTRQFLSGEFVEPQSAFSHCQLNLELI